MVSPVTYLQETKGTFNKLLVLAGSRKKTTKYLAIKNILNLYLLRVSASLIILQNGSGEDIDANYKVSVYEKMYQPVIEYLEKEI